jgi:hypothetical protein
MSGAFRISLVDKALRHDTSHDFRVSASPSGYHVSCIPPTRHVDVHSEDEVLELAGAYYAYQISRIKEWENEKLRRRRKADAQKATELENFNKEDHRKILLFFACVILLAVALLAAQ